MIVEMKLLDCYKKIYSDTGLWKYYKGMIFDKPFEVTPEFSESFIRTYLRAGQKYDLPSVRKLDDLRLNHTLSTYYLGLYLLHALELELSFNKYHSDFPHFTYYWFLLCLCHDIGYTKENSPLTKSRRVNSNPGLIESAIRGIFDNNKNALPNSIRERVPYSPKLIEDYNYYIQEECGHMEHGTEGVIDLFYGLLKHHDDLVIHYGPAGATSFIFNKVRISRESISRFAEISALVAIHNIWLANNPITKGLYESFKNGDLKALIDTKYYIGTDAILFWVLELADSIEPLKRCSEVSSHKSILESISISASRHEDICKVIITYNPRKLCPSFVKAWISGIEDMQKWIDGFSFNHDYVAHKFEISFLINTV